MKAMHLQCYRPVAQPVVCGPSSSSSSHNSQRLHSSAACRPLPAAGSGSGGQRGARGGSSGGGGASRLAVECKKQKGGGTGQQRAQQAAAKQREQQVGGKSSNGGGGGPIASATPGGFTLSAATLQQLDLSNIDKLEVRGNEVVLTLRDPAATGDDDPNAPLAAEAEEKQEEVMDGVVKIYCTHTEPNYSLPWQRKRQYSSTSSGFVVVASEPQQRYLLTNAHSVEYYSQVKVKKRGDDRKWLAKVLAIGTECDIALLTVDDDEFWNGVQPLRFGPLPNLQESVYVVGYPIGGDTISVTSGVVSRIEVTAYAHGATELLGVQIDAAINSGNSGGPVFNELGEVVGIAFQSYAGSDAENIGYVIPTPVIGHFLDDYQRNGTFTGFPALGVQWQRMESGALRQHFNMKEDQKGVLVRSVQQISHAHGVLFPGDVLLAFDGVEVASDGTVPFLSGERIAFSYLTSQKFTGDVATLDILRKGEPMSLPIKLMRPNSLVQHHLNGRDPSYLVVAGIVFTVVTEPYLESEYGAEYGREAPIKLLDKLLHSWKDHPDQQVVIINQVLACNATLGYEETFNTQVHKFNGQPVRNLRHLAEMVIACQEQHMRFDVDYSEVIVIDTVAAREVTDEMLRLHSIPAIVSKDMTDLLTGSEGTQQPAAVQQEGAAAVETEAAVPVAVAAEAAVAEVATPAGAVEAAAEAPTVEAAAAAAAPAQ